MKPKTYINNTECEKSYFLTESVKLIAGIDEAGRGPLAGPVSVGLCVFDRNFIFSKIPESLSLMNDSKKVKEDQRYLLADSVRQNALFSCTIHVDSRKVDTLNINGAIERAIILALERSRKFGFQIDAALIDGNYKFRTLENTFPECEFTSIVKGDQNVFSIASASMLAKTTRDTRLCKYDKIFPGYGFASHKGYGTKKHKDAIRELGPTIIHRKSFRW